MPSAKRVEARRNPATTHRERRFKNGTFLLVGVVLSLVVPAPANAACIDLTAHDTASLMHYRFEAGADTEALAKVPWDRDLRVGEVRIVTQPIFDPDHPRERAWLFELADRVHVDTRHSVVENIVLFESGAAIDKQSLEESERLLRDKPYLFDARIIPRRLCDDILDIDIVVRDVWTLMPRFDFTRAGGDNEWGLGLEDVNFLGSGRIIGAGYSKDEDREGWDFFFVDPNVRGSRVRLHLEFEDNDDGSQQFAALGLPFYSVNTKRAWHAAVDNVDQEQGLYFLSDKVSEFRHEYLTSTALLGFSGGLKDGWVNRWRVGFTYDDHTFEEIPGVQPPDPFPEDRKLSYPWVSYEKLENRYEKTANLDRVERTEDVFMGKRFLWELGYSDEIFGADDQSRLVYYTGYWDAMWFRDNLLTYGADIRGWWNFEENEEEDLQVRGIATYQLRQRERFAFFTKLDATYVSNRPVDKQILLGGTFGLRGYPNRYQTGDKRILLNLEERYYSDIYLLRLFRLGFAAFVDVGRAWSSDSPSGDEFGVLANVGVGVRFESTRTRRDRIAHLDLAFPLVDGQNVDSVQVLFTVKRTL